MRKRIFRSLILISVIVLLLSSLISTAFLQNYFNREQVGMLSVELKLAAEAVNKLGTAYFDALDSDIYRFTIIDIGGNVLYDTHADITTMNNHSNREEVIEAFSDGYGSSARYSSTLTEKTFYEALLLDNSTVLRVSINQLSINGAFLKVLPMNLLITFIAIIASVIYSKRVSKQITAPLLSLDLENPTENVTYEELSPILSRIHRQHNQIVEQMETLAQKNGELNQILSSMSEGLVMLDEHGSIIMMNASARDIFSAPEDVLGKDFLTIERSNELNRAIHGTADSGHSESSLMKNGRQYQLNISLIKTDGKTVGTLILAFDVTEKAFAERNRQEFTANVSHELKTPLQSIIGSAELLENGLVKPEDTERFIGNIKKEAERLVSLINDIIRLSQLDEKAEPDMENIELKELAAEVLEVLSPAAAHKNVKLSAKCEPISVRGVRRYIYEIIYNLCDNAIRYNVDGGTVELKIERERKHNVISISDTGIGIAPEHHARIFERFYRVDKSHSKETGGTGLGLSIVKRAVLLHGGSLELKSEPGRGSTVKVLLP